MFETTNGPAARAGLALAAVGLLAGTLAGCTSSGGGTTATGVTSSVHPTTSAASSGGSSGAPAANGSPTAGASTSGAAANGAAASGAAANGAGNGVGNGAGNAAATAGPSLPAKKGAKLPCNAAGLVVHLSQASGAVHGYLAKPGTAGPTVIALKSRTAAANGAKAARFAAYHLTTGLQSAGGCATTGALTSVATQTSGYLTKLASLLASSAATAKQIGNAEALMADVASQANRAGLTIVDKVPTPSLLQQQ
ncbi:MAG: hypothetical protein ACXV1K_04100 [Kineosporiaceae bacterium]